MAREIQFESQAEAMDRFQDTFADQPDLVDAVDVDELPSAFKVKLTDGDRTEEYIREFGDAEGVGYDF